MWNGWMNSWWYVVFRLLSTVAWVFLRTASKKLFDFSFDFLLFYFRPSSWLLLLVRAVVACLQESPISWTHLRWKMSFFRVRVLHTRCINICLYMFTSTRYLVQLLFCPFLRSRFISQILYCSSCNFSFHFFTWKQREGKNLTVFLLLHHRHAHHETNYYGSLFMWNTLVIGMILCQPTFSLFFFTRFACLPLSFSQ